MGKVAKRMPHFCLSRIRPLVRVRSPDDKNMKSASIASGEYIKESISVCRKNSGALSSRKIMIVVDPTVEAKNAVQWALGHSVQDQDMIILLYVTKPPKKDNESINKDVTSLKVPEFLTRMKDLCQLKRPEVNFEVVVVEGKEKGLVIVEEAKRQEVVLLVLGQKKQSMTWRLMVMWTRNNRALGCGVAEYCVQNASCMAIAVRRKSKKLGGYLITTKRQKDFWLLA